MKWLFLPDDVPRQSSLLIFIYGITALCFVVSSFFVSGSLDIAFHDTYLVIAHTQILLALALYFAILTLVYRIIFAAGKTMNSLVTWSHYGISMLSFLVMALMTKFAVKTTETYRDYSVLDDVLRHESEISVNEWLTVVVIVFTLSQITLILTFLLTFLRRRER